MLSSTIFITKVYEYMNPTQLTRFESLYPHLTRISRHLASNDQNPDDVYQVMNLGVLERASSDPSFLDQKDAYILYYAKCCAKHWIRSARRKAVNPLPEADCEDTEDDSFDSVFFMMDDRAVDPEQKLILKETLERIKHLEVSNQKLCVMIYLGYSQNEIAETLGVDKSAISHRKETIRLTLAGCERTNLNSFKRGRKMLKNIPVTVVIIDVTRDPLLTSRDKANLRRHVRIMKKWVRRAKLTAESTNPEMCSQVENKTSIGLCR